MTAFRERVREAVQDDHLHTALERATGQLSSRREAALASLESPDAVRDQARQAKLAVLGDLAHHLEEFERKLTANGVTVHWAPTAADARETVLAIARQRGLRTVVKAKSMVTEEIHLNEALEQGGLEVVETDLGEYVAQLAGERPSHIILPIIHMTRQDVGRLFERKLAEPYSDEPAVLTRIARRKLRRRFLEADLGISGANFGVVETGSICLVSNEGNIRMVTTLPRVHVAILGLEKLVPTLTDLDRCLKILARSATGQKITVYTSLVQGPRRAAVEEGPEEVHVILLDNGRSETLAGDRAEILACIRCGACLNACPVYQQIGGHAYGDTYPGPMGSILTPALRGLEGWEELPQASSLCGACRDVCPVRIDLPRLLLSFRRETVEQLRVPWGQRFLMRMFGAIGCRPRLYRTLMRVGGWLLRLVARDGWVRRVPGPLSGWTRCRDFKAPARRSFQDWWRARERADG